VESLEHKIIWLMRVFLCKPMLFVQINNKELSKACPEYINTARSVRPFRLEKHKPADVLLRIVNEK